MSEVKLESGEVLAEDGEIISKETVEFAYTRQGRHEIGKEYPNPTPIAPPIGFVPSDPVHEVIARMVMRGVAEQIARERGEDFESPEEADDFEVGDDFDPEAPYEHDFEPTQPWPASRAVEELTRAINEERNRSRIGALQAELEALQNGRPWPPAPPSAPAGNPASPSPAPSTEPAQGN